MHRSATVNQSLGYKAQGGAFQAANSPYRTARNAFQKRKKAPHNRGKKTGMQGTP
jgi:hypothetical protein